MKSLSAILKSTAYTGMSGRAEVVPPIAGGCVGPQSASSQVVILSRLQG